MKPAASLAILALLAAIPAGYAQTTTYYWTETGSSFGNASGTLTFETTPFNSDNNEGFFSGTGYDYHIDDFQGSFTSGSDNGTSIVHALGYLNLPNATPSTSFLGIIEFMFIGGDHFVFERGSGYGAYEFVDTDQSVTDSGTDIFTLSDQAPAVPELPVNPGLMAAAGLFIGWRTWRMRRPMVVKA